MAVVFGVRKSHAIKRDGQQYVDLNRRQSATMLSDVPGRESSGLIQTNVCHGSAATEQIPTR
jgi:hypothetical protein